MCVLTWEFKKFSGGGGDGGEEKKETKSRGERRDPSLSDYFYFLQFLKKFIEV